MQKLLNLLEASSSLLVSLDPNNLVSLEHLHSDYNKMKVVVEELKIDPQRSLQIQTASDAIATLIEKIIFREIDDSLQAIRSVSDATTRLIEFVQCMDHGDSEHETSLPALLDLDQLMNPSRLKLNGITLPQNVDEDIFHEFLGGQPHVLENLEGAVLAAENDPITDNIDAVKAILHSIKGESGLMGLEELAAACHQAESLIDESDSNFPAQKILETNKQNLYLS